MNTAVSTPSLRRAIKSLSTLPFQTNYMSTGARGARGHGWLHKYRGGLGGRHLQGRFHKRDIEKRVSINNEVFEMNDAKGGNNMTYLDINFGGKEGTKRITIELASAALPQTCKNFMALCNDGTNGYESCKVFKIEPKVGLCLGDISGSNNGLKGSCHPSVADGINSDTFAHESVVLSHAQKGMVSMISTGLDKNDSRFMITTVDDAPHLDGKHVAFGRVKEGLEVLEDLVANVYTKKGRPTVDITVASCGTM